MILNVFPSDSGDQRLVLARESDEHPGAPPRKSLTARRLVCAEPNHDRAESGRGAENDADQQLGEGSVAGRRDARGVELPLRHGRLVLRPGLNLRVAFVDLEMGADCTLAER